MPALAARNATVRLLQEQDIPIATELSSEAGWNQTMEDWHTLLDIAPEGCFGIDADGRLVSTATLVCYGRQLGWIGMVLTTAEYRRRGFARALLEHCIERSDQLGIQSLKLDATDQGQPLYESLGFRAEQPVERWWRAGMGAADQGQAHCSFAGDLAAYGVDRSRLLQLLAKRGAVRAGIEAFCVSRPGRRANYVGPCIASSPHVARGFIEALAQPDSYWDLLPWNQTALTLAAELGFTPQRKLVRMGRGRELRGREEWLYAIAGFEFG